MTTAMRALRTSGPRVLRIGVVQRGQITEERVVRDRASVTVGPHEGSTFVVDAAVPPRFQLFERAGEGYVLNVVDGMSGRIALSTGVVEVSSHPGSARRIRLDDESRGKVTLGDTTLLFQFVTPPPPATQPRLPLSVKNGAFSQIDWTLAVVAAFSFLLHFGLVGGMYSDWGDGVVDDDFSVGLVHMVQPPVAAPVDMVADAATTTTATPSDSTTATPSPSPAPTHPPHPAPAVVDPMNVDALLRTTDRMGIALVTSVRPGDNLTRAMSTPEAPPIDLNALANRPTTVDSRPGALDLPVSVGTIQVGPRSPLPVVPIDEPTSVTVIPRVVPPFDVREERPIAPATVVNAEAIIRNQIHPGARRCYQQGLAKDDTQSGKLMLQIHVGPSGEVDAATVTSNTGLSPAVASCIAGVARRAHFDSPGPSGANIVVPFAFWTHG
jgi:hypothetical protein